MFKVITAEIKKILSKPSIYILALILAAILVLGVFIYKPTTRKNSTIVLDGETFTAKYAVFNSTGGYKTTSNELVNKSKGAVNSYTINYNGENINRKTHIDKLYANVLTEFYGYRNFAAYNEDLNSQMQQQKEKLVSAVAILDAEINSALEKNLNNSYSLISTNKNYKEYSAVVNEINDWLEVSPEKETLAAHCKIFEGELKPKLDACLNEFVYPTLSLDLIKTYTINEEGTKLFEVNSRLKEIETEIETINKSVIENGVLENKKQAAKMDELANLYYQTANTYASLVKYELICNAFEHTSTKQQLDLLHLKDYSNFNNKSLLIKYNYLFENNKSEFNYANPLTIGTTSNFEINAFDYAYFIMKLFSFVIIAYFVMMACFSIAGEIKEGSMRYFAIRPISRTEIYFGKLLAIIVLATILIIFSSIIAVCVGIAVYGIESLNILTIFNGSKAIVMHPIVMLLICLLNFVIEVSIYTSFALLLSTLFKSDVLSVTIMLVFYLINILLPLFVQGANSWLSYYPLSHTSIYALFGSSVYATNNFFNLLLGAKVYATTNLFLTLVVIVVLISAVNIIASKIFKHKEL